jgi:ABC-2 type transport system ATP-binding protein
VVLTVLKEHAAAGAPVLFSSHQLDLVERLCDDLVIIAAGEIRANGSRERLRDQSSPPRFEIHTDADAGWIRGVTGITVIGFDGGEAVFEADSDAASQAVLREALSRGAVHTFGHLRPTLATIFKEVVQ